METWPDYVRRIAHGLTHAQIAARMGGTVSMSNIGRWLRGELTTPGADHVIAFAKGFGLSPIEALAAAGYIDPADAIPAARTPLNRYATTELLDELRRRATD